jgi:hypothetical protein
VTPHYIITSPAHFLFCISTSGLISLPPNLSLFHPHLIILTQLVAYPLSLLGVSIRAMQGALEGLKEGRVPSPEQLGSFEDIQNAVGFPVSGSDEAEVLK